MAKYQRKKYALGSNLSYNGNPVIDQSTSDPYEDKSNKGLSTGQYVAAGTALSTGAADSYQTFNQPDSTIRQKSESMDGATMGTASAINPIVGGIIGIGNAIGKPIRNNAERMDENGELVNQRGAQVGAVVGGLFDPIKALTTRASYKGGWTDLTGKGYANALEAEAQAAMPKPEAPVYNKDYSQDAVWQATNNQKQFGMGGDLTQYEGFKHEQGGIPIGPQNEVEAGETRGPETSATKDYIFSDKLRVPGKKYTFAKASKMIETKHSKRDNDKLSAEQKERELKALMDTHEATRISIMERAYKKAYGGKLNKLGKGGWIDGVWVDNIDQSGPRADGTGGDPNAFADNSNITSTTKDLYNTAMLNPNAVNRNDGTNKLALTAESARQASNYRVPGSDVPMESMPSREMAPLASNPSLPQTMEPQTNPDGTPSFDTPYQPKQRNFDPNNLYNMGNFMGATYDIYRGAKGGDPVNYERAKTETINPELVSYQTSRDLNRRDISQGYRNTQRDVRNSGVGQAGYLSMLTQLAARRDQTTSDSTAKSIEAENNMNSQIRNGANQFNAAAKNQGNQFNAQVQMNEANSRQQEKDVASNTLQAGLAGFGEALAGTGRDKAAYISQEESKKFIGSSDYSPVYDKGKITGYKHKVNGKMYLIGE